MAAIAQPSLSLCNSEIAARASGDDEDLGMERIPDVPLHRGSNEDENTGEGRKQRTCTGATCDRERNRS